MFILKTYFDPCPRCLYLARCYAPVKKYAEALTLIQHANINVRETLSTLSLLDAGDPISFYPLSTEKDVSALERDLSTTGLEMKRDWFTYNGGSADSTVPKTDKKPLFFDIAVNYVPLDMERLRERAGKQPSVVTSVVPSVLEKKPTKVVEDLRAATPEPQQAAAPARGGLSSLLGGWWGRS